MQLKFLLLQLVSIASYTIREETFFVKLWEEYGSTVSTTTF